MILNELILENFCAFGGRQQVQLTPETNKPIILFGGMNGGGKTTLLDALQLVLYGSKARLSNRGKLKYEDYLRESIHRGSDPSEGASISLRFQRVIEGEVHDFEVQRNWRIGIKNQIEEFLHVLQDGQPDQILSEHWQESIESYLPSSISHLFFFDGEQIKELAEGQHAAEIISTAIHSLLGLDLVERLFSDLKVFERRKRDFLIDQKTLQKLVDARNQVDTLNQEAETVSMKFGSLTNEANTLSKKVEAAEEKFRNEGGELFLNREQLKQELTELQEQKNKAENSLRELAAGVLPFSLLQKNLQQIEKQARLEVDIRQSKTINQALKSRDQEILKWLKTDLDASQLQNFKERLKSDRKKRHRLSETQLILEAEEDFLARLLHLLSVQIPEAQNQTGEWMQRLEKTEEKIYRLEIELERIPEESQIAQLQQELEEGRQKLQEINRERKKNEELKNSLSQQILHAEKQLELKETQELDLKYEEEDRLRMLKHSEKVRRTLERYRQVILKKHSQRLESLIFESLEALLRKPDLVKDLSIDSDSFQTKLLGRDGKNLGFNRLSAGERQLLATSMLWGLARASGRPLPTVIDTPLGRLDSSHRKHLVERYFPNVSHQLLLLSTDEEIKGTYYQSLKPFISHQYHLQHNNSTGATHIQSGYFT